MKKEKKHCNKDCVCNFFSFRMRCKKSQHAMFHLLGILNYKFFTSKFFCNASAPRICLLLPQNFFFILRVWYWKPEVTFKELYSQRHLLLRIFFDATRFPTSVMNHTTKLRPIAAVLVEQRKCPLKGIGWVINPWEVDRSVSRELHGIGVAQ